MRINDKMRLQGVKRWHIVETVRQQSVAEHSFNVAMIAHEIATRSDYHEILAGAVVWQSLLHDLDEVTKGDMPCPHDSEIPIPESYVHQVVKAADLIEASWFINTFGVGAHARAVAKDCRIRAMLFVDRLESHIQSAALDVWRELYDENFQLR